MLKIVQVTKTGQQFCDFVSIYDLRIRIWPHKVIVIKYITTIGDFYSN